MSQIKPLDKTSVNRICSGQVIVDLKTSVKELIENALDAGATTIEIKLKQNGAETIEVKDNGSGIESGDRAYVVLKNYTSKLKDYSDLDGVSSYGFRGEALHSLAQLSSLLYIITKTQSEPCGTKLEYNQKGELTKQTKLASKTGTTIHIEGLFKTLPVRRVDFMKNLKSHYYKLIDNLTSYSICRPDIRFYCENINSQGKKQIVINTQGKSTLSNIITQHWTIGYFKQLQPFIFKFNKNISSSSQVQNSQTNNNNNSLTNEMINNYWKDIGDLEYEECIYGYISDGKTISNNEHQLLYLNLRPIDNSRIIKIFNQTWKSKGYNYHPNLILNIHLLPGNYDINLSPDKRDVMIKDENLLLEQLTNKLQFIWKPKSIRFDSNSSSQDSQKCSDDILYSDDDDIVSGNNGSGINVPIDITEDNDDNNNIKLETQNTANNNEIISNSLTHISLSQSSLLSQSNNDDNDNYMLVFSELPTQTTNKSQKCDNNNNHIDDDDDNNNDFVEKVETIVEEEKEKKSSKKSKLNIQLIDDDVSGNSNNNLLSSQSQNHKTSQSSNHSNISDVMMCDLDKELTPNTNQKRNNNNRNSNSGSRSRSRSRSTSPVIKRKIKEITSEERERRTKKKYDKPSKKENSEKWEIPKLDMNDRDRRSEYVEDEAFEEKLSKKNRIDTSSYIRSLFQNNSNKNDSNNDNKRIEKENDDIEDDVSTEPGSPIDVNEMNYNNDVVNNPEDQNIIQNQNIEEEEDDDDEKGCRLDTHTQEYKDLVLVSPPDILFSKITIDDILNNNNDSDNNSDSTDNQNDDNSNNNNTSKHFSGYKLDNETANKEFERLITKEDFERMEIIGQFNLGFIIVKLGRDIFLIDQHASDEKYNFEKLQETTQIHEQNLICAEPLDLGLSNEDIILNHLDIFEENGFRFEVNDSNLVGRRLSLISKPFSKNLEFNKQDIIELCMLLLDCPTSHPKIPKIMNMFASRACRSSVMIGQALNKKGMKKIVSHLSELEHPWNCPHGRPTMRHLFTLPN